MAAKPLVSHDKGLSDRPQTCGLRARFPDCLSTHRFACFDGQQSRRECIFPFRTAPQFSMVVPHLRTVPLLAARCSVAAHCASLRVLATSALRAFTFLQAFASTVRNRRSASLASSLATLVAHWAYYALFRSTIHNGRLAAPNGLQCSLVHWTSASPVSRTARGEAPSHRARASCAPQKIPEMTYTPSFLMKASFFRYFVNALKPFVPRGKGLWHFWR